MADGVRGRFAGAWLWVGVLCRALAVLLAVQLTGSSHAAVDLFNVVVDGHAEHEERCPVDRPCDDCPPGCPSCHCAGAPRSVAAGTGQSPALAPALNGALQRPEGARGPSDPDPQSLFRPPRA